MKYKSLLGFIFEPDIAAQDGVIGGACNLSGAVSPNSGRPLVQLASICVKGGPIKRDDWKLDSVVLLYGWSCAICEDEFIYQQHKDEIRILKFNAGDAHSDFPYENYPDSFPRISIRMTPIGKAQQKRINLINSAVQAGKSDLLMQFPDLSIPRHQIGGVPYYLAAEPPGSICPLCDAEMEYFATIGNQNYVDARGFTGNDFVQLVYEICADCSVIAVNNYTD